MTARIEPSLLGKMSERQVLRILQSHGPLSRAEVARHTGLSAPAVSRAVANLLRLGLLEETSTAQATGGRPATRLRLASQNAQVLGAAIDADRCLVVSAGLDGLLHEPSRSFDTPDSYPQLLRCLAEAARSLMDRPGVTTLGLGISLPGLVDYRTGRAVLSPNLPLTNGQTPARDLADRLGLDCIVLQESHALCLAEQHHGLARGLEDFAMLDVQTGVGLGVVTGGRLLTGHSGLAGEIGHITVVPDGQRCGCGNVGCLETVASDTSLARRVSRRLGRPVSIEEVLHLARSPHYDLTADLDDYCRYLALAVAAVINLFNPSRLFVHGRGFEADPTLFARLIERASRRSLSPSFRDCRILRATGQKHQGAVAGIICQLTSAIAPALQTNPLGLLSEVRHALPSA
jgi:predicted NBD/HSP70 family sugar kinase